MEDVKNEMNLLFVCTGNTCRSPIAEAMTDDALERSSTTGVKTKSAGTFACEDSEATPYAQQVMEEIGLSLEKHRSQQITPELVKWADIILAMGKEQIEQLEAIAPDAKDKLHTLLGYVAGVYGDPIDHNYDVIDPFDEELEDYRACVEQLKGAVDKLAEKLKQEEV